uniref:E3 ubiquitin-protein ligase n=1 Tax=Macrostomum lignano TaxID=282301 RepID=A0A1I8HF44_9PLAT
LQDPTALFANPKLSVSVKIERLTNFLETAPVFEVHTALPTLLDNILGYDGDANWRLLSRPSPNSSAAASSSWSSSGSGSSAEYRLILSFLAPAGPLCQCLLRRLLPDQACRYDFPVSRLSHRTQCLLLQQSDAASNATADASLHFFRQRFNQTVAANAASSSAAGAPVLRLNALELLLFNLIGHPAHVGCRASDWRGSVDYLYCQLLMLYMQHFLLMTDYSVQLFDRDFAAAAIAPAVDVDGFGYGYGYSSLIGRAGRTGAGEPPYPVDCFVQSLLEFWIGWCCLDCRHAPCLTTCSGIARDFLEDLHPTPDHVCLVRLAVKYLHHFAYAPRLAGLPRPDTSPGRRSCSWVPTATAASGCHVCCNRSWPALALCGLADAPGNWWDGRLPGTGWSAFVESNAHFYADLWLGLLRRLARADLRVPRFAHMLHRCLSVYCRARPLLADAFSVAAAAAAANAGGGTSPSRQSAMQMSDGCGSGAALWWQRQAEVTRLGAELLRACVDAKRRSGLKSGSVAADSADNNNYDDQAEVRTRVVDYLADSARLLALVCDLGGDEAVAEAEAEAEASGADLSTGTALPRPQTSPWSSGPLDSQAPDVAPDGTLTPLGRYQLANNARRFQYMPYSGDWDRWLAGYPTLLVMLAAYAAYSCLLGYKSLALFCLLIAFTKFCLLVLDEACWIWRFGSANPAGATTASNSTSSSASKSPALD